MSDSACVQKKADGGTCTLGNRECNSDTCTNGKCCGTKGQSKGCTNCNSNGDCSSCSSGFILVSGACTATTTTETTTTTTLMANGARCNAASECLSSDCKKGRCVGASKPGSSCSSGYDCGNSVCRGNVCCSSKGSSLGCQACDASVLAGQGDCVTCGSGFVLTDGQCKQTTTTTITKTTTTHTTTTITATTTTITLPLVRCKTNEYRVGENPGACKACSNVSCKADAFRTGECKGTSNDFQCIQHPQCQVGREHLAGATGTKKGQCLPCSNIKCAAGQYRVGECKGSANKFECRVQTTCKRGEYLIGASAVDQGTCKEQTVCQKGQFLSGASTIAPGVCKPCPATAFQGTGNHRHSTCQPFAVCKQGQFETTKPTSISDRTCGNIRNCSAVEYQAKPPSTTSNRQCVELAKCREGERVTLPAKKDAQGVLISDLECGACSDGGYQDQTLHRFEVCKALPVCPSKQYLKGSSKTSSGNCVACANIKCVKGQYRVGECKGSANKFECRVQPTCKRGEYLTDASVVKEGTCKPQTVCQKGQFISGASTTAPGVCKPCPATAFQGTGNHRHSTCQPFAVCKQGQFETTKPTSISDRTCGNIRNCSAVEYQAKPPSTTSNRQCVELAKCREGERVTLPAKKDAQGVLISDLECGACSDGGYQDQTLHRFEVCKALPVCPSKQYLKGSSKTSSGNCVACANLQCPINEYQGGTCSGTSNGLTCTACSNVSCGNDAYREGTCTGRTNGYQCQKQTKCAQNEFLAGAGEQKKGECQTTSTTTTTTVTTTTATTTTTTATTTTTTTTTTYNAPSGCNTNCTNSMYSNSVCDLECNSYYCRYDHGACSRAMAKDVQQARLMAKLGKIVEAQALFEIVCDGLSAFPPDRDTWLNISGLEHKARVKEFDYQRMFSVTSCISAKNLGLPKTFTGKKGAVVNNGGSFDAKKLSVMAKFDALQAIDAQISRVSQLSKLFAHRENVGTNIQTKGLGQLDENAYRMISDQLANSTTNIQAFVKNVLVSNQTGGVDPAIALLAKDMRSIIGNGSTGMVQTLNRHTQELRDRAVSNMKKLAQVLSLQRRMVVDMMNKAASNGDALGDLEVEVDELDKDVNTYIEGTQRFGERVKYLTVYENPNPVDVSVADLDGSETSLALSQRLILIGLKRDQEAWTQLGVSIQRAVADLLANTRAPKDLVKQDVAGVNAAMHEEKKETTGFSLLDNKVGGLTYSQKKTLKEIEANSVITTKLDPEEKTIIRKILTGATNVRELAEAPRKAINEVMSVQRALTGFSHVYDADGDGLACATERVALVLDTVVHETTHAGNAWSA